MPGQPLAASWQMQQPWQFSTFRLNCQAEHWASKGTLDLHCQVKHCGKTCSSTRQHFIQAWSLPDGIRPFPAGHATGNNTNARVCKPQTNKQNVGNWQPIRQGTECRHKHTGMVKPAMECPLTATTSNNLHCACLWQTTSVTKRAKLYKAYANRAANNASPAASVLHISSISAPMAHGSPAHQHSQHFPCGHLAIAFDHIVLLE